MHVYLTYPFVLSWSLLEAMASGCAVVASDTAPVREVIRQAENGLLVDFFSTQQLLKAVGEVLTHPTRMQSMRDQARMTASEGYAVEAATKTYLELMGCEKPLLPQRGRGVAQHHAKTPCGTLQASACL